LTFSIRAEPVPLLANVARAVHAFVSCSTIAHGLSLEKSVPNGGFRPSSTSASSLAVIRTPRKILFAQREQKGTPDSAAASGLPKISAAEKRPFSTVNTG
jgi:hypothetical protein